MKEKSLLLPILLTGLMILSAFFVPNVKADPPTTEATDIDGTPQSSFYEIESVYVTAAGLTAGQYHIYVIEDPLPVQQISLTSLDVSEGPEYLQTDSDGNIDVTQAWFEYDDMPTGDYHIVIDVNDDNYYGVGDATDSFAIAGWDNQRVVSCDSGGDREREFYTDEDVYAKGEGFSEVPNLRIDLYVCEAQDGWSDNDALIDVDNVESVYTSDGTFPATLIWASTLSTGHYDVVAHVYNPLYEDKYIEATDAVYKNTGNGFTVKVRPPPEPPEPDHLEGDIASNEDRDHTNTFATDEDVYGWIWYPPGHNKTGEQQTQVDIYVYANRNWEDNDALNDVNDESGGHETVTTSEDCGNTPESGQVLLWAGDLDVGHYDIIIDWDQDGQYDKGYDVIDGAEISGFQVPNPEQ